jgi:hypothetical protein
VPPVRTIPVYYSDSVEEDEQLILSGWTRHPQDPELFCWLRDVPRC